MKRGRQRRRRSEGGLESNTSMGSIQAGNRAGKMETEWLRRRTNQVAAAAENGRRMTDGPHGPRLTEFTLVLLVRRSGAHALQSRVLYARAAS